MNSPQLPLSPPGRPVPSTSARAKWWIEFVADGERGKFRAVFRWHRILTAALIFCGAIYLLLVTSLWAYYAGYRKIPAVDWFDIAVPGRFERVRTAVGAYYYEQAKRYWEKHEFVPAIITARAAVQKSPGNLDARLFLAGCWREATRFDEAVQTLREGIDTNGTDLRLQKALVETCLDTRHYRDLLKVLRDELPARGVRLLEGSDREFQLAEVQAVFETGGAAAASEIARQRAGFSEVPAAAPLLARIDWELNRLEPAFKRLGVAREREPRDPWIQDAYVEAALRLGRPDLARGASEEFLAAFPGFEPAQLRFLEAHGSRQGADRSLWTNECLRFLVEFRHTPGALTQLSDLAASEGWTDLALFLYQNSLQEHLAGFPFVINYVGSLVKTGDFSTAETLWRELQLHHAPQLVSSPHLEAMVLWGAGHESEALQIIERLRHESSGDLSRQRNLGQVFRKFGFPGIAEALAREPETELKRANPGEK